MTGQQTEPAAVAGNGNGSAAADGADETTFAGRDGTGWRSRPSAGPGRPSARRGTGCTGGANWWPRVGIMIASAAVLYVVFRVTDWR